VPDYPIQKRAEMLDTLGMQQGGTQYRRLIASFQRIFGATIFFGSDIQRDKTAVFHKARFNFMSEARIWYSRDHEQQTLPGGCQNEIVLSAEFYREVMAHPIPADLDAAKALSSSPAALDLFMWISYRCFTAKGEERAKAEKAGQFVAFTERMARSKTTEHIEWPPFRTRPGRAAEPAILSGPWAKSRSDACGVTPSVSGRLRTGPDRHLPPASRQSRARVRRPRFGQTC
jgi:hypothetical protein